MFLRWKKAILVILLICWSKHRWGSNRTPRFLTDALCGMRERAVGWEQCALVTTWVAWEPKSKFCAHNCNKIYSGQIQNINLPQIVVLPQPSLAFLRSVCRWLWVNCWLVVHPPTPLEEEERFKTGKTVGGCWLSCVWVSERAVTKKGHPFVQWKHVKESGGGCMPGGREGGMLRPTVAGNGKKTKWMLCTQSLTAEEQVISALCNWCHLLERGVGGDQFARPNWFTDLQRIIVQMCSLVAAGRNGVNWKNNNKD